MDHKNLIIASANTKGITFQGERSCFLIQKEKIISAAPMSISNIQETTVIAGMEYS